MNSATIAVRTTPQVKDQARHVFEQLGMDMSTAINLFLKQSVVDQGLPFQPSLHINENRQARYEAEHHIGKSFATVDDLLKDLNADD